MKYEQYNTSALVDCPFYTSHSPTYIRCEGRRLLRTEYPLKVCESDYKHCPQYQFMMKYVYKVKE